MRKAMLTIGVVVSLCAAPAVGAQPIDPQVMAPIRTFVDAFNKGDAAGAAATHATDADLVIIDEVAPFLWRGPQAFQAWAGDLGREGKAQGMTEQKVTLGTPTRMEVSGASAYVIVPSTYSFKQKGVAMRETAQMTITLKKGSSGWLIHGWAWTGGRPTKAAPAR